MLNSTTRLLLCTTVLVAVAMPTHAASKKTAPVKPAPAKSAPVEAPQKKGPTYDSSKSFDMTASQLPAGYLGHDIEGLYAWFLKEYKAKDEFETVAAYEARMSAARFDSIYGFVLSTKSSVNMEYNAEKATLFVRVPVSTASNFDRTLSKDLSISESVKRVPVIDVKNELISTDTYKGTNAYGATREITSYFMKDFGIGLLNVDRFNNRSGSSYASKERQVTIPMDAQSARGLKDNIGTMLICQVRAGGKPLAFTFRSGMSNEATITSPVALTTSSSYLNVEVLAVWFFDKRNGQILLKESIEIPQQMPSTSAAKGKKKGYSPPPYLWEENGSMQAANNINDVPEAKRAAFEVDLPAER